MADCGTERSAPIGACQPSLPHVHRGALYRAGQEPIGRPLLPGTPETVIPAGVLGLKRMIIILNNTLGAYYVPSPVLNTL